MKRSDNLIRALSVLIFLALACYIGVYAYDRWKNPFVTARAQSVETAESISIQGYIVRDERAVWVDGQYTAFQIENGQKVYSGQNIAAVYSSEAAYARYEQRRQLLMERDSLLRLQAAGGTQSAVYESIITMNLAARQNDLGGVEGAVLGLENLLLGGQADIDARLAEIDRQLAGIDAASIGDTEYITAPCAGVFCTASDGYERIDTASVTGLSPAELDALFSTAAPADCKLVHGIGWCYAAVLEDEDARRLDEGVEVTVSFAALSGGGVQMTVENIGPSDTLGRRVVVFSSSKDLEKVLSLRQQSATVVLSRSSAVSIPQAAILHGKDGSPFIYVISGLQARRVDVQVIEIQGDYALVTSDSRLLADGVQVIVQGSELYDGKVVA